VLKTCGKVIKPRIDVMNHPDCLIHVSEAEDGLPLVLGVHREQDLRAGLSALANYLERELDSSPLDSVERVFREEGKKVWRNRGLHDGSACNCARARSPNQPQSRTVPRYASRGGIIRLRYLVEALARLTCESRATVSAWLFLLVWG
jgi:hypothetical protein